MKEEGFGKRIWRTLYPLLAYNGISYLVSFLATFLIMAIVSQQFGVIDTTDVYTSYVEKVLEISMAYTYEIQVVSAMISIPLMVLFMRLDKKRRLAEGTWKTYEKLSPVLLVFAVGLGLAASYAANNLILISGLQQVADGYDQLAESFFKGNLLAELVGLGVIIPIVEELIFRGLMHERMKEFMDLRVAAVAGSICFAAAHGNLVQAVFSFFLGLLMVYVYERYHSIWAPIAFHVVSNMLAVIQSETTLLDFLFNAPVPFYGSTVVMCIVVVLMVVLIEKYVCSEERMPVEE